MMNDWIPIDLIIEIVSRLPAKSIARCLCVSKLWRSTLSSQDFTELFFTRSSARPRLLISVEQDGKWNFFTSSQSQNRHEKSSSLILAAADFHINFSKGRRQHHCSYTSGLIYFPKDFDEFPKKFDGEVERVICNPMTGQYVILPELRNVRGFSYLGFDPIDKEFKVLFLNTNGSFIASNDADHYILTLGSGELKWRKIQFPETHEPWCPRICINGVLYYLAGRYVEFGLMPHHVIVCFDVRSEKFKFIDDIDSFCYSNLFLVNYKGKIGLINYSCWDTKFSMCVLEDVEKQEWSSYDYVGVDWNLSVAGVTATGDIVFSPKIGIYEPFHVLYLNPEKNTLQRVKIQGIGANRDCRVYSFVDYVEDLSVVDAMHLQSSTVKQVQDLVKKRPKPQKRRHTSSDLCESAQSVKNKQHNKYELSANLLDQFVSLAILFFVFVILFSSIILFA